MQDELSPSHPAWPMLTFKLARVYAHVRDPRLKPTLEALLQKAPSSPYAQEAQAHARPGRPGGGGARPDAGRPGAAHRQVPAPGRGGDARHQAGAQGKRRRAGGEGHPGRSRPVPRARWRSWSSRTARRRPSARSSARTAGGRRWWRRTWACRCSTLTRNEDITDIGPFVFRNMLTYSAQARALAAWATEVMGYKSFAVLYPNTPYGVEMTNDFWDQVTHAGRGGARRGDLRQRPDHLHHRGEEAGGPLLPR